ncbi:histidine--tRNA ligase [Rubrobacter xylanophilus]|uniref:Histidine--tRNA ligase n=1 Tax=Rubrobacter xylanophilus TaxID=49319 RepID=A0A510HFT6_9ACTN|nr:histidine--tRNA ligase [Rubrobacter xylanophilus]BBL78804.1 histidine--tRNA ligase [Rubrobacter xylanophilus]
MSHRRPKGTYDVYPGDPSRQEPHERPDLWDRLYDAVRDLFRRYGYAEVRTPVFEEAELFVRSTGETSDIVRKEMFVFRDKGGRELALRPEGTAGVVRAYVEHGLYKLAQPVKMWYFGPMFRHERQQKGRYRQHTQIGAEVLGSDDPLVDVEVIALLYAIHRSAGVRKEVIHLNNLGDVETRRRYVPELRAFLERHRSELDPDSVARIETNPLRTFDSKDPNTRAVLQEAPLIGEYLSEEASAYLKAVREGLEALGIPHVLDERLVRGLDYYTSTVFEAKSPVLGAQDTVGAGGRYNRLVEELGGPDMPGIGFGTGVERILLAAEAGGGESALDAFFVTLTPEARLPALRLAEALRAEGLSCELDYAGRSPKGQFRQADRAGASYAVVLGEEELSGGFCTVRDMESGEERRVSVAEGPEELLRAVAG